MHYLVSRLVCKAKSRRATNKNCKARKVTIRPNLSKTIKLKINIRLNVPNILPKVGPAVI